VDDLLGRVLLPLPLLLMVDALFADEDGGFIRLEVLLLRPLRLLLLPMVPDDNFLRLSS
jgi:hypothetical protein